MNTSEEDYKIVSELFSEIAKGCKCKLTLNSDTMFASVDFNKDNRVLHMCYIFGNRRVFIDDGDMIAWIDISNRDNLRERIEHYIGGWRESAK